MADASVVTESGNGGAAAAGAGTAWHEGLDADTKGWVTGKGFDKLDAAAVLPELVKGYRGAEKTLGLPAEQVLRLPGEKATADEIKAFRSKLGVPDSPDGYEIKPPDGHDDSFLKTAVGWFHELGVPKSTAAGIAAKWNEHVQALQVAAEGRWNEQSEKDIAELKREWGVNSDRNFDLSQRVERATGLTPEQLGGVEGALGPKAYRQFLVRFGSALGEHRFVDDGAPKGFGMTPEGARGRLADLQKDDAWRAKYFAGDADAKAEFTRLNEIAYANAA